MTNMRSHIYKGLLSRSCDNDDNPRSRSRSPPGRGARHRDRDHNQNRDRDRSRDRVQDRNRDRPRLSYRRRGGLMKASEVMAKARCVRTKYDLIKHMILLVLNGQWPVFLIFLFNRFTRSIFLVNEAKVWNGPTIWPEVQMVSWNVCFTRRPRTENTFGQRYLRVCSFETEEKVKYQKHLSNGNGSYIVQLFVLCHTT